MNKNNYTTSLTAEEWKKTFMKTRVKRVKDLTKYFQWVKSNFGSYSPRAMFVRREIENIRGSILPENAEKLNAQIAISMQTAKFFTEHGELRGFKNVKSWFSLVGIGDVLGETNEQPKSDEVYRFVVSCDFNGVTECFTLVELFGTPRQLKTELRHEITIETLRRVEYLFEERQKLVDVLNVFYKEDGNY